MDALAEVMAELKKISATQDQIMKTLAERFTPCRFAPSMPDNFGHGISGHSGNGHHFIGDDGNNHDISFYPVKRGQP